MAAKKESHGERGREGGREGGEGAQRWSLIAMRPSIALAPSLTHSLSADIKEMGVSKGGWSASETRLVVSHETTLLPAPRRQELQTATRGFTSTSSQSALAYLGRLVTIAACIDIDRRAHSIFELKRFYGESVPMTEATASPRANCQVFKGVVAV